MGRGGPNLGKRADAQLREAAALPAEPIGTEGHATGVVKMIEDADLRTCPERNWRWPS